MCNKILIIFTTLIAVLTPSIGQGFPKIPKIKIPDVLKVQKSCKLISYETAKTKYEPKVVRFVEVVNLERKRNGLNELQISELLVNAAERQARAMIRNNSDEHVIEGMGPLERLKAAGYQAGVYGEALRRDTDLGSQELFDIWNSDPDIREIFLQEDVTHIGFMRARLNDTNIYTYSLILATPRLRSGMCQARSLDSLLDELNEPIDPTKMVDRTSPQVRIENSLKMLEANINMRFEDSCKVRWSEAFSEPDMNGYYWYDVTVGGADQSKQYTVSAELNIFHKEWGSAIKVIHLLKSETDILSFCKEKPQPDENKVFGETVKIHTGTATVFSDCMDNNELKNCGEMPVFGFKNENSSAVFSVPMDGNVRRMYLNFDKRLEDSSKELNDSFKEKQRKFEDAYGTRKRELESQLNNIDQRFKARFDEEKSKLNDAKEQLNRKLDRDLNNVIKHFDSQLQPKRDELRELAARAGSAVTGEVRARIEKLTSEVSGLEKMLEEEKANVENIFKSKKDELLSAYEEEKSKLEEELGLEKGGAMDQLRNILSNSPAVRGTPRFTFGDKDVVAVEVYSDQVVNTPPASQGGGYEAKLSGGLNGFLLGGDGVDLLKMDASVRRSIRPMKASGHIGVRFLGQPLNADFNEDVDTHLLDGDKFGSLSYTVFYVPFTVVIVPCFVMGEVTGTAGYRKVDLKSIPLENGAAEHKVAFTLFADLSLEVFSGVGFARGLRAGITGKLSFIKADLELAAKYSERNGHACVEMGTKDVSTMDGYIYSTLETPVHVLGEMQIDAMVKACEFSGVVIKKFVKELEKFGEQTGEFVRDPIKKGGETVKHYEHEYYHYRDMFFGSIGVENGSIDCGSGDIGGSLGKMIDDACGAAKNPMGFTGQVLSQAVNGVSKFGKKAEEFIRNPIKSIFGLNSTPSNHVTCSSVGDAAKKLMDFTQTMEIFHKKGKRIDNHLIYSTCNQSLIGI